jgi:hypothetical protein
MSQCLFKKTECLHFLLLPSSQQWFLWLSFIKLAASRYSVLWSLPQDPSFPCFSFIYSMVSLVFKVPVPFQENWMPAFFAVPSLQQWFLWLSFIKLAASRYSVLWSLPKTLPSHAWFLYSMVSLVFKVPVPFQENWMPAFFAAPSLQQWFLWLSFIKLAASCYSVLWSLPQDPSFPCLVPLL